MSQEIQPRPSQADHLSAALRAMADDEPNVDRPALVPFRLAEFSGEVLRRSHDAEFDLTIDLGQAHLEPHAAAALGTGSVVTLDQLAGDPVEIRVNGRLTARGELAVLQDKFCVRITELVAQRAAA